MTTTQGIAILATVNVITFVLFGLDKHRAGRHAWRIPERTLWLSAVAGGGVGAWLGVSVFRHKTRKLGFRAVLVLATLAGGALWTWLFVR